jgi:hypothetical protein
VCFRQWLEVIVDGNREKKQRGSRICGCQRWSWLVEGDRGGGGGAMEPWRRANGVGDDEDMTNLLER